MSHYEKEREKAAAELGKLIHSVTKAKLAVNNVNHPAHYNSHPSGVETIDIVEHMNFCLGNAIKYILRAGIKTSDPTEDLEKARWYIDRELERLCKSK